MAVSKIDHYSQETLDLATIARALAHPARVTIINLLEKEEIVTNKKLTEKLKLSKATIHEHLRKISEAGLIRSDYRDKHAVITRTGLHPTLIKYFINQ